MTTLQKLSIAAVAVTTGAAVALLSTQPAPANPPPLTFTWEPGGYSNFVVVTSTDLKLWQVYLETTDTYFQVVPNEPKRFFALYGTNSDGDSAWAGK